MRSQLIRTPRADDEEWWESYIPGGLPFGQTEMQAAFAHVATLRRFWIKKHVLVGQQERRLAGINAPTTRLVPPDHPRISRG